MREIKSRKRDIRLKVWANTVFDKWGYKCPHCNNRELIAPCHIIPRNNLITKFLLENGIAFCYEMHRYLDSCSIEDKKKIIDKYCGKGHFDKLLNISRKINTVEEYDFTVIG